MDSMDAKELGRQIRKYRKLAHLTIDQLAEKVDLASSTLKHYECGYKSPSLSTLIRISNALNVGMDMLLYDKLYAARDIVLTRLDAKLKNLSPDQIRVVSDLIDVAITHMDKFSKPK